MINTFNPHVYQNIFTPYIYIPKHTYLKFTSNICINMGAGVSEIMDTCLAATSEIT